MKLNSLVCLCFATSLFSSLPAKEYVSPPVPASHVADFGIKLAPVVDWSTEFRQQPKGGRALLPCFREGRRPRVTALQHHSDNLPP
jgi:hypothetical protein